jgi:hypothetical protein
MISTSETTPDTTLEPVTPDEFSHALVSHGILPTGTRVEHVSGAPIGQGHMGDSFQVEMKYSPDAAGPTTLFLKMPPTDERSAALNSRIGAYNREARFYREIAPRVSAGNPKFYGEIERKGIGSGLLLEDLSGHTGISQIDGTSPEILGRALAPLAALHAGFWNDESTRSLPWLFNRLDRLDELSERYAFSWSTLKEIVGAALSGQQREVVERFGSSSTSWAESISGPMTLIHQDVRLDNLMFSEERAWLLDWQLLGWGSPAFDLSYAISTSLHPEERRMAERDLLSQYVTHLQAAGVEWSVEELWETYRRSTFYTLLGLIPAMGHVKQSSRGFDMFRIMLDRATKQILDLDALDYLT